MPIPFKDISDAQPTGSAGYLKFIPNAVSDVWLGALFVMDVRGEPVEFAYSRIRAPKETFWRPDDLRDHCVRSMCASMFDVCPASPIVIFCLADEVGINVFGRDLSVDAAIARLQVQDQDVRVDWIKPPEPNSRAELLFDTLDRRGLLIEPFSRAEAGLREVYSDLLK